MSEPMQVPVHSTDERDRVQPPIYIIDLSRPPRERYTEVALAFKDRVQSLPVLFDQLAEDVGLNKIWAQRLARLLLRRVKRSEETEELRGISAVTGIDLYLLVNMEFPLLCWTDVFKDLSQRAA